MHKNCHYYRTLQMDTQENRGLSLLVLGIVSIICLGISGYQFFIGYKDLLGGPVIAGLLAIVVVILLFYFSFQTRLAILNGKNPWKYFIFFLIIAILSFFGNFNAFYTLLMGDEVISDELKSKRIKFSVLKESSKVALQNNNNNNLIGNIDDLKAQMVAQIKDPENSGCGEECQEILVSIESSIDTKITRLSNNNTPDFLAAEYSKLIDNALEQKLKASDEFKRRALAEEIDNEFKKMDSEISRALKSSSEYGLLTITKVVKVYNELGNKVKYAAKNFSFEELTNDNERFGKISHTFRSAKAYSNNFGTWVAAILAFFVDLFVPIFILFSTSPLDKQSTSHGLPNKKGKISVLE